MLLVVSDTTSNGPVRNGGGGGVRLFEVDAVASVGHDDQVGVSEAFDQASAESGELGVVFADEHQYGALDLVEPVPQRYLRAGASQQRRLAASPAAVLRRRSARSDVVSVSPAKSGLRSHSSMNVGTPTSSM